VLVGLILHALTRDRAAAAIGGLSLLAFPPVAYWSSLYRVDALALALSLGGVCLCARRPEGRWTVPVAALLLTAAICTRQSYGLAAPLAAALWLLQAGGWRRALALVGLVLALGAALFRGTRTGYRRWLLLEHRHRQSQRIPGRLARGVPGGRVDADASGPGG